MAKGIAAISEYTVEDLFKEIESRKIIIDRQPIQEWLFEYSCKTCEYEGLIAGENGSYVKYLIKSKLYDVLKCADEIYWETDRSFLFHHLEKSEISSLIEKEHQK
jgi:hypothetical protein